MILSKKLKEMLEEFAGVKVFKDILMMFRLWCYDNIANPITAGEVYADVVSLVIEARYFSNLERE